MKTALLSLGGALGTGAVWAIGWALVGALIEWFVDPDGCIADIWISAMAIPGFLGGVIFFAVLRTAGLRRADVHPIAHAGAWGAVNGLLVGAIAVAFGVARLILPELWLRGAVLLGFTTLLSVATASLLGLRLRGRSRA